MLFPLLLVKPFLPPPSLSSFFPFLLYLVPFPPRFALPFLSFFFLLSFPSSLSFLLPLPSALPSAFCLTFPPIFIFLPFFSLSPSFHAASLSRVCNFCFHVHTGPRLLRYVGAISFFKPFLALQSNQQAISLANWFPGESGAKRCWSVLWA